MDKILKISAGLLAAALCICCSKNTLSGYRDADVIGYNVVTSTSSQPVRGASSFPTDATFISSAYALPLSQNWDSDAASATPEFGPEEVKWQATYWSTDTQHYWSSDRKLTFFSYAPASLKEGYGVYINQDGVNVNSWDVLGTHKDKTLLVADIAKDKVKNESFAGFTGVPTHFRNKLAKVTFRVASSDLVEKGTKVVLTRASLSGFYSKGNFAKGGSPSEGWYNLDNKQSDYVLFDGENELTPAWQEKEWIMIPQSTTGLSLSLEYRTEIGSVIKNETVTLSLVDDFRSGIWEKGTHVTYSMKIGAGRIPILFDGTAEDWVFDGGNIIEIE